MKRTSKNREGSRLPSGSVQPLLWLIKEKSCFKQSYFKILLTCLIKTLFTDLLSSLGINPQIKSLILLDFSRKQEQMLTIQSAISIGESVKRLLFHTIQPPFSAMEVLIDSWLAKAHFSLGLLQFLHLIPLMG